MDADSTDIQIPGYRILSLIGEGANATVYLALQESLNRHVALKILQKFDRPAQAVRFFNEGQIVASMNHPNIITIYDIGSVGSQQYIAMEYLDSGSLRDRVKEGVSPAVALDIIHSLGSALEFVHQMGIVHRDIKPENILFHKSGIPKITDFGVAKALDRDMNLTLDGTALGSPYYLSPEQAEGKDLDGRSDIYSLGVILFELLAQRKPYLGKSQIEVIFGHMNKPIPALPQAYRQYQALVEKMMAKDANERFASTREMLDCLNTLRGLGDNPSSRRSSDKDRREKAAHNGTSSGLLSFLHEHPLLSTVAAIAIVVAVAALLMTAPSPLPIAAIAPEDNTAPATAEETRVSDATSRTTENEVSGADATPVDESPAFDPPAEELVDTAIADNTDPASPVIDDEEEAASPQTTGEEMAVNGSQDSASAVQENSDTENTASTDVSEDNIEFLLQKAEVALKKYRLTSPRTDSAYYYYTRALQLDPANKEASRGIRKLAGKYGFLADKALQKEDEKKARSYIERGLRIQPKNAALLARMTHLDELEAARLAPPPPPPEPVKPPPPKLKPKPVNTSLQLLESLE